MKKDIWDYIFWLLLATSLTIIILRITGIINTPLWLQYAPLITIIFSAGIAFQKFLAFQTTIYRRTDYLKNKTENNEKNISSLGKNITSIEKSIFSIEKNQELITKLLTKKK